MPGPLPKPAHLRQRRNKRSEVGLVERQTDLAVPEPDPEWLPATSAEWASYWQSDVSGLVSKESDLSAVRRLFHYRDEHARALKGYRAERLGQGSTGQVKVSPMGQMMAKLEGLILPLEDRYGLSSLARLRLGAELGGATKSLAEMNAALDERAGGNDADDNAEDVVVELPGLPRAQ